MALDIRHVYLEFVGKYTSVYKKYINYAHTFWNANFHDYCLKLLNSRGVFWFPVSCHAPWCNIEFRVLHTRGLYLSYLSTKLYRSFKGGRRTESMRSVTQISFSNWWAACISSLIVSLVYVYSCWEWLQAVFFPLYFSFLSFWCWCGLSG